MRMNGYTPTSIYDKVNDEAGREGLIKKARRRFSRKITLQTSRAVNRLQKYSVKKDKDFNYNNPKVNKALADIYNVPIRFIQSQVGMLPSSMQEKIASYRNKKGVNETPDEYTKYSVRFSYSLATLKVAGGFGLLSVPVLAFGGAAIIAWGAWLILVENPIRHYLRKKGKPKGVFFPFQMMNPFVKQVINLNGKRNNNTESTKDKSLEQILN